MKVDNYMARPIKYSVETCRDCEGTGIKIMDEISFEDWLMFEFCPVKHYRLQYDTIEELIAHVPAAKAAYDLYKAKGGRICDNCGGEGKYEVKE
jgi:hypothetical protein